MVETQSDLPPNPVKTHPPMIETQSNPPPKSESQSDPPPMCETKRDKKVKKLLVRVSAKDSYVTFATKHTSIKEVYTIT